MIDNTRDTQPGMTCMRKNLKIEPMSVGQKSSEDIIIVNKHSFEKARIFYQVENPQELSGQIDVFLYCDDRNLGSISSVRFYNDDNNPEKLVSDLFNIECMDRFVITIMNSCDGDIKITSLSMMCRG